MNGVGLYPVSFQAVEDHDGLHVRDVAVKSDFFFFDRVLGIGCRIGKEKDRENDDDRFIHGTLIFYEGYNI